jgi:hypothetical protein
LSYRIFWHGPPPITYLYETPEKALRKAQTLARNGAAFTVYENDVPLTVQELATHSSQVSDN